MCDSVKNPRGLCCIHVHICERHNKEHKKSYGKSNFEVFKVEIFNRSQQAQYKDCLSAVGKITSGVPQGSIFGPLLFIVLIDDISTCLKHSNVTIYADDTGIFVAGMDTIIITTRLSSDMRLISEWCNHNEFNLNLNQGKIESMLFDTANNLAKQPKTLNVIYRNKSINATISYKYLCVDIGHSLNLNSNIDHTYREPAEA